MSMKYDVHAVEKKWQQLWRDHPIGQSRPTGDGKKFYCLDMFPYPSGSGLHVGHWRGYVLSDVYTRIKWLEGYNILHPMGWDAFGLPAENDAIKKGVHPKESTARNIAQFKRQLEAICALYDWSKELNTTDPAYYKWTQWIFIKMYEAGLAYQDERPVNWCPSCLTGLANEEVVNGACERCNTPVEQKKIKQWVLRITAYAQKLLDGLDDLAWPEKVKLMQRNWIGKSTGMLLSFPLADPKNSLALSVFTTRPDTIYGATFIIMAPDHELVDQVVIPERRREVDAFLKRIAQVASAHDEPEKKLGAFTGSFVRNPVNNELLPVYLANYVLKEYGTGIVMAVPAHDERDFAFAKHYNLPIKVVIESPFEHFDEQGNLKAAYGNDGYLINSGPFDGLDAQKERWSFIAQYLYDRGFGELKTTYKLRDWIFSRQRYWGEPIPLVHCQKCGVVPVPEDELPVALPDVQEYKPTGTGESPLADIPSWVNTICPVCDGPAKRETNTMPQWAGSCWYFLRYPNPNLEGKPFDQDDVNYWLPVDLYVGGIEHAILHLLYARFYVKVLHDLGYLPFSEPFLHLFNQGMITKYSDKSGAVEKMSKSKGNVVNPDEMVKVYGSDVLRMYILFMGPPELDCEWQDSGLEGIKRFLQKLWNYLTDPAHRLPQGVDQELATIKRLHRFLKEFQERIAHFKPNTAISAFMEWLNDAQANSMRLDDASLKALLVTLSTMAPHMASELLQQLLELKIQECTWPTYEPELAEPESVTIGVQVNGKTRGSVTIPHDAQQDIVEPLARKEVAKWLEQREVVKVIFVLNRLINFVVR